MNATPKEANESDSKFDDDELNVYSISEDQLWDRSELEEMRAPKTLTTKKSASNTGDLNETIDGGLETAPAKKVLRARSTTASAGAGAGADSRPDFYHGVGPYNDVNLPGVWFFRIPHKVLVVTGLLYLSLQNRHIKSLFCSLLMLPILVPLSPPPSFEHDVNIFLKSSGSVLVLSSCHRNIYIRFRG